MNNNLYELAGNLFRQGQPFAWVTLVDGEGSVPQDAGAKMLVDATGRRAGTIGGGTLEHRAEAVAGEMLRGEPKQFPHLVVWDLKKDLGMDCGGRVRLLFEVVRPASWTVAIFGAGHVGQALVRVLEPMNCRLLVIDRRAEWLERLPQSPNIEPVRIDSPPEYARSLPPGAFALCVGPSHEEDLAVLHAVLRIEAPLPYVGAIGSHRKSETMREALTESGVREERAGALRCPIGLPVGNNDPAEIAVSIAAELLRERDSLKQTSMTNSQ